MIKKTNRKIWFRTAPLKLEERCIYVHCPDDSDSHYYPKCMEFVKYKGEWVLLGEIIALCGCSSDGFANWGFTQ